MDEVFDESELPDYINWAEAKTVTPVKDQGRCGSWWAFTAVGALDGAHFVKSGKLLSFSEQQLIDCSSRDKFENHGCHGGDMYFAFA